MSTQTFDINIPLLIFLMPLETGFFLFTSEILAVCFLNPTEKSFGWVMCLPTRASLVSSISIFIQLYVSHLHFPPRFSIPSHQSLRQISFTPSSFDEDICLIPAAKHIRDNIIVFSSTENPGYQEHLQWLDDIASSSTAKMKKDITAVTWRLSDQRAEIFFLKWCQLADH